MKRSLLAMLAMAVSLALSACAMSPTGSVDPNNAKAVVFQAEGVYRTGLIAATTYRELPRCSDIVKQPCSDLKVVQQLQKSALAAKAALDSAESVAYTPGLGQNAAVNAANAAMQAAKALTGITATLGAKK